MKTLTIAFSGAALFAALAAPVPATAQLPGLYNLPPDDFMWRWGHAEREREHGDFSARGSEQGFQCELRGDLSASSRLTPNEVRDLENKLTGRLDFIYAAATLAQQLEYSRDLDWAVLECEKGAKATQSTPEEKAENEARAREKMQREIERRRERAQRDSD
jgi:hypothetical protein